MKQIRKRLTYANVMSSLAVFLVLGGGAAIASNHIVPKNSVGSEQIQANAVETNKLDRNAVKTGKIALEAVKAGKLAKNAVPTNRLRDNAVSAEKIANGSVLTDKISDAAVTSAKLANGSVLTDKIAAGAVGAGKLGAIQRVITQSAVATAIGQTRNVTATCPAGTVAISGGAAWVTTAGNVSTVAGIIRVSQPVPATAGLGAPTGWQVTGELDENFNRHLRAYAICLSS